MEISKAIEIMSNKELHSNAFKIFTREGQTEQFQKEQPVYYDKSNCWWLWDNKDLCWKLTDEVDVLNMIRERHGADIITSKSRTEILNSLKQSGRKNEPKPFPKTWIQFKDRIFDIYNGVSFKPTPEYFTVNPIPFEINFEVDTPTFDKLFTEWVGDQYKEQLYEILAYCLIPDYPIHRLFCLIGEGLNGKSCYLRIVRSFIGEQNTCATELDTLLNSRFEITRLYKKLICLMGETNFTEMAKTSVLKKLTGQDLIGFEYKNKVPFESTNYAKILIATNNLPATTDKTIGFYRRWLIIDFPNRFDEGQDILASIPQSEYSNLASKCLTLLPTLLQRRTFTNEGSIEERLKKYEEKSNPFDKFWNEHIEEEPNSNISKRDFAEKLERWCKENRFRSMSDVTISKHMKDKGIETFRKTMEWIDVPYNKEKPRYFTWGGIKWKN